MLKTQILLAFRHLKKEKGYTLVSMLGLALAFTACFFTLTFVIHEYSADLHFADQEHTFQLKYNDSYQSPVRFNSLPISTASFLEENYPEVDVAVPFYQEGGEMEVKYNGEVFLERLWVYTEPEITGFFKDEYFQTSYPFQTGSVLVSRSAAEKIFGAYDVLGKILEVEEGNYVVAGIFENFPSNSQIQPEFLAVPLPDKKMKYSQGMVYVRVHPGTDVALLNQKIDADAARMERYIEAIYYHLVNVGDIYLSEGNSDLLTRNADLEMVRMMVTISIIILFIAGFNVASLTQVKTLFRGREIGVKKVLGITLRQLFFQFFTESFVVVLFSVLLALSMVQVLRSAVNGFLNLRNLSWEVAGAFLFLLVLLKVVVLATMQTILFSKVMPRLVMGGRFKVGEKKWLLKGLVATQFTMASVLIGGALLTGKQLQFITSKPLGFNIDNLWYIEVPSNKVDLSLLKERLAGIPEVETATVSSGIPFEGYGGMINETDEGPEFIPYLAVDKDFVSTFQFRYVEPPLTDLPESGVIINQRAQATPEFDVEKVMESKVVGVVEDFHFSSLTSPIRLMILSVENVKTHYLTMRIHNGMTETLRQKIEGEWEVLYPGRPFELQSLAGTFLAKHQSAVRLTEVMKILAVIAVFISCIGLASLTGFFVKKRFKEIAIRKVLGANAWQLIRQINSAYLLLIGIVVMVSVVFIYWLGTEWLAGYAYATDINGVVLLAPGVTLLLISGTIMITRTWKTASANPVEALRSE